LLPNGYRVLKAPASWCAWQPFNEPETGWRQLGVVSNSEADIHYCSLSAYILFSSHHGIFPATFRITRCESCRSLFQWEMLLHISAKDAESERGAEEHTERGRGEEEREITLYMHAVTLPAGPAQSAHFAFCDCWILWLGTRCWTLKAVTAIGAWPRDSC
jgi:hypothetical protein